MKIQSKFIIILFLISCTEKPLIKDDLYERYSLIFDISKKDTLITFIYKVPKYDVDSSFSFLMFGKMDSVGSIHNLSSDPSFYMENNKVSLKKTFLDNLVLNQGYTLFIEEYLIDSNVNKKILKGKSWSHAFKGNKVLSQTFVVIDYLALTDRSLKREQ